MNEPFREDGVLQLAAAGTALEEASALAEQCGGTLYADERDNWGHLPFRSLVTVTTDDLEAVRAVGDIGVYLVYRRLIKPGVPKVVGLFPMVRAPQLSHADADGHWRDVHAPLALEHHAHMSHYSQLSVVATLEGLPLDGIALVGFASESDLRNRFYTGPDSPRVIAEDTRRFADHENSPRRLIARAYSFPLA